MRYEKNMSNILVVLAHPNLSASKLNKTLKEAIIDLPNVTLNDLYTSYPTWQIDAAHEQQMLVANDVIVLQFPFYWYSTPALLKEWQDKVLAWGFAFGTEGTALVGKKILVVTTTGGAQESYSETGQNKHTVEELLLPLRQTASLCGMIWQTPVVVHGATTISDEDLAKAASEYQKLLASL